jgi:hypothetical protein
MKTKLCFYPAQKGLHAALTAAARKYILLTIQGAKTRPGALTKTHLAYLLGMDRNQLHRWLKALDIEI